MIGLDLSPVGHALPSFETWVAVGTVGDLTSADMELFLQRPPGRMRSRRRSILFHSAALHPVRLALRVSESHPMGNVVS